MDASADVMLGARPAVRTSVRRTLEACAFACLLVVNWILAAQIPSQVFSYTSLLLFVWMALLMIRLHPRAAILALPLLITRGATLISLVFIEAGSAMPEIGRSGVAGDASASFVAVSTLLFLVFTLVFGAGVGAVLRAVRSALLDRLVALLHWPVIGLCAALGLLAMVQGLHTGFPVFEHVDRFYYRRFYGQGIVLVLLDNKFLLGAMLGAVAFGRAAPWITRAAAVGTLLGLLLTFFLFGDKFFTLLTTATYFLMPYLLRHEQALLKTFARGWLVAALALAGVFAATLYIYSDYGDAPLSVGMMKLGERIAGQGELWFVATQDDRRLLAYDPNMVRSYAASLNAEDPAAFDFQTGVETFFFINRYTPQPLRQSFHRNQGWVQLTMGSEALALAGFGYLGVALLTAAAGAVAALPALYLRRAFASEFPLSIALALWTSLQAYSLLQQGAVWAIFARGQLRRFLLFFIFEVVLFAANRAQAGGRVNREEPGRAVAA